MPTTPRHTVIAGLPTGEDFGVTSDALEMIRAFGGTLHCFSGPGGCRATGLYFSRTLPRKPVHCTLYPAETSGSTTSMDSGAPGSQPAFEDVQLSVSPDLSAQLQGAVLDFGNYNWMQRFIWLQLPSAGDARCGCRRSFGARTGKHSPCLDKQAVGLTDL